MTNNTKTGKINCPHCKELHPIGTQFCPVTGKQILGQNKFEELENEVKNLQTEGKELKGEIRKHKKKSSFFSIVSVILVIILLVGGGIVIFNEKGNKTGGEGNRNTPKSIPEVLRAGEKIMLKYQAEPRQPQWVPEMVEAYLRLFDASSVQRTKVSDEEIAVKAVIPGKDKPVNAEIRLQALETINGGSGEKQVGAIEDFKKQLAAEKKKGEETENQLAAAKKENQAIQNQLILIEEQKKKREIEAQFSQKKTSREAVETKLKEAKVKKQLMGEIKKRKSLEKQLREKEAESKSALNFLALQPELKNDYYSKLKGVNGLALPEEIKTVKGELSLILAVGKNGTIKIQQFIHDYMNVSPKEKTDDIIKMISKRIRNIYLPIPRKRDGTPVEVENWGLRYKLTTFEETVTLEVY
jgi:hypothetical protein